jgi:hypothetical protein
LIFQLGDPVTVSNPNHHRRRSEGVVVCTATTIDVEYVNGPDRGLVGSHNPNDLDRIVF